MRVFIAQPESTRCQLSPSATRQPQIPTSTAAASRAHRAKVRRRPRRTSPRKRPPKGSGLCNTRTGVPGTPAGANAKHQLSAGNSGGAGLGRTPRRGRSRSTRYLRANTHTRTPPADQPADQQDRRTRHLIRTSVGLLQYLMRDNVSTNKTQHNTILHRPDPNIVPQRHSPCRAQPGIPL